MIKQAQLLFFLLFVVSKSFSQSDFTLIVSDTSALDLTLNLTTDRQIEDRYFKFFVKPPHTDTIIISKCIDCKESRKEFSTSYEIKIYSLSIVCVTNGFNLLDKKLNLIVINASTPTKTNLSNFILSKSLVKDVEKEFVINAKTDRSWLLLYFDRERKFLYLAKDKRNHFYFGVHAVSEKRVKKSQIVDRILIGNY